MDCELQLEEIKSGFLCEHIPQIEEYRLSVGDEIFETVYELNLIHEELKNIKKSHVILQIIREFLRIYSGKTPFWIHFEITRKILDEDTAYDSDALEVLTHNFLKYCQKLYKSMAYPSQLDDAIKECKAEAASAGSNEKQSLEILEFPRTSCEFEKALIRDDLFLWDWYYLKILADTGKTGKDAAKTIRPKLQDYVKNYFANNDITRLYGFWFTRPDESNRSNFFFSPALKILSEVVWNDISKGRYELKRKSCPAIPKSVLTTTLKPTLSHGSRIENDKLYSSTGNVLAVVPCIDPKLIGLIKRGMTMFFSLTGHKLVRWEIEMGYKNWIDGIEDPRFITVLGGYEYLARLIGCGRSNKVSGEVKALLHAQTYGKFNFPDGSQGNMLSHRVVGVHKNGEPVQINIVLGELLMPNYTHSLPKGEKRRLIPITELPPLIGAKNTHAAQAMLQLLVLEEFSNQSRKLVENGSIFLPLSKWEAMAQDANLPRSRLSVVIDGWVSGNSECDAFLERYGDDYKLAKSYARVTSFLEEQGEKRMAGARAGKKSAAQRKRFAIKGFSTRKST